MKSPYRFARTFIVLSTMVATTGCASLSPNTKKAPCGPLAGLTDPCGNRTPINNHDEIESIFADELGETTGI